MEGWPLSIYDMILCLLLMTGTAYALGWAFGRGWFHSYRDFLRDIQKGDTNG